MKCSFNQGRDAVLQLGIGTEWGVGGNAVIRLPFESESLTFVPNYVESAALMGNAFVGRMDILSEHTEGDFSTYITPDEISFLLYLALGIEFKQIDSGDEKKHLFVPVKSGGSKCLPQANLEVDRLKDVYKYISHKVNSLTIDGSREDYIKVSVDTVGYDELDGQTLTPNVKASSKDYFKFRKATVTGDRLASDSIASAGAGKLTETFSAAANLTGAQGLEIDVFARDVNGYAYVYRFVGTPITRTEGTTVTFSADVAADQIPAIHDVNHKLDTANWMVLTEEMLDVYEFSFSLENNLQNDKFTSGYGGKLAPINPNGRTSSVSLSSYLNDEVVGIRKERYKAGRYMSVALEFESYNKSAAGNPLRFGIILDRCYIEGVDSNVDSPDELEASIDLVVSERPDADYVAVTTDDPPQAGTGEAGDELMVLAGEKLLPGMYVEALDPDGYPRMYKYLGDAVDGAGGGVAFADDGTLKSIWLADGIFHDAYWQMADAIVAYVIDDIDDTVVS